MSGSWWHSGLHKDSVCFVRTSLEFCHCFSFCTWPIRIHCRGRICNICCNQLWTEAFFECCRCNLPSRRCFLLRHRWLLCQDRVKSSLSVFFGKVWEHYMSLRASICVSVLHWQTFEKVRWYIMDMAWYGYGMLRLWFELCMPKGTAQLITFIKSKYVGGAVISSHVCPCQQVSKGWGHAVILVHRCT